MIAKPVAKGYKIGLISLPEYFDTHTHSGNRELNFHPPLNPPLIKIY